MVENLRTKSEFAAQKGVTPGAITHAIKRGRLAAAIVGKKIDITHPAAVAFGTQRDDDRFEEAVKICHDADRWTQSHLKKHMKVNTERAKKLIQLMAAEGIIPNGVKVPAPKPGPPKPTTAGNGSARGDESSVRIGKQAKKTAPPEEPTGDNLLDVPDDIRELADWSLRDLVVKFGNDIRFLDWLKSAKMIEDIKEKQLKNARAADELVSRDMVKTGVLDHVNTAHVKILTDGAKTIAVRVSSMAQSGREVDDCETFVREQIESFIRPMKARIARALK